MSLGIDSRGLFEHVMATIQSWPPSKERCDAAKKSCDTLEQQIRDMAVEIGVDYNRIENDAKGLRARERGDDILQALNYLSVFTEEGDSRINNNEHKSKYLSGVQYFVIVSREYLSRRMETADYYASHPEELEKILKG